MNSRRFIFVLLSMTFIANIVLFAQEQEEKGNVFTISTFKVRYGDVDEYLKLSEGVEGPMTVQNEFIISRKVFKHLWGPDWRIIIIAEYKDFAAIGKAQAKYDELWKNKYPDKAERDKINKKISDYVLGHTDAIVSELPKFRK